MDQSKGSASASGGKKGGNFFAKTAQSIRDKVQGLSKINGAKKEKKSKEKKSKISSKSNAPNKPDSGVDSDEEIATTKSESSPPPSAAARLELSKVTRDRTNPSTTASANPRNLPDKEPSSDSAIKLSDNRQDAVASPSSSSPTSSPESSTTNSNDVINKNNPPTNNTKKQIQLSFAGLRTVDDLFDRIDEAIEHGSSARTTIKSTNLDKATLSDDDDDDEEPIQIDYNQIHSIDDILSKINQQPGNRRVIIKNAPDRPTIIPLEEQTISPSTSDDSQLKPLLPSTRSTQSDDPSVPPKSILKTSQNPSSLDTSTRISSFQDEQIHVNIENPTGLESHDDSTSESEESDQNDEITPTVEKKQTPPKFFSVSKAQVIEKHYDDYPSSLISPTSQRDTSNASSTQKKSEENETTDWL